MYIPVGIRVATYWIFMTHNYLMECSIQSSPTCSKAIFFTIVEYNQLIPNIDRAIQIFYQIIKPLQTSPWFVRALYRLDSRSRFITFLAPLFPQMILRFKSGEHQIKFPYQVPHQAFYIQANRTGPANQPAVSLSHSLISKIAAYPILPNPELQTERPCS